MSFTLRFLRGQLETDFEEPSTPHGRVKKDSTRGVEFEVSFIILRTALILAHSVRTPNTNYQKFY